MNVYSAGDLWRMRLNYDGNVLSLNVLVVGATSSGDFIFLFQDNIYLLSSFILIVVTLTSMC